ncbi:MAG TPA: hypothetical protein VN515_04905 [Terriglobales bacterium]|nr:hypothetical protein [Terriglobales bacterium]
MKHLTTLATVSLLAVSSWAATLPSHSSAVPISGSLALPGYQAAACPTPAPAVDPKTRTWKHGDAEYKDFTAITSATDNTQKAQLAAAFVQKYPDSSYKNTALQIEMTAQAAVPSLQAQAVQTATEIMKSSSADASVLLPAYVIISYADPNLVQANDPDMAAKMATLLQASTCGQQLLAQQPAAAQTQYMPILVKAQGFAQMNTKDYAGAIATLTKAAQLKPTDPLPYYWMGVTKVTQAPPDYNTGIFDLAKASVLSPQTAAFKSYLTTVYTQYHGSADGLQDVITAATNNAAPPADFKVMSSVDVQNAAAQAAYQAQLEKLKNQLPPADSFAGIEARLKKPDMAADEWKTVKGVGYELDGLVTDVTAKTIDIAVGATDPSTPADVHVVLDQPLTKRPKVGDKVTVDGLAESFKPNPPDASGQFVLTMTKGSVKGYSPAGK